MGVTISKTTSGSISASLTSSLTSEIASLASAHPREAAVIFQRPLSWRTSVEADVFKSGFSKQGSSVQSTDTKPDGSPVLSLQNGMISIHNFASLAKFFEVAGDKKAAELKAGLDANRDPVSNILGREYGHGADLLATFEELNGGKKSDDNLNFRLLLLLNAMDVKLLQSADGSSSKDSKLTVNSVESELDLLRSFSGTDDQACLEAIDWESAYVFSNGLRAPPYRQMYGDLGYILVQPVKEAPFTLLANVNGYWQIKGAEGSTMNYEKIGETYPSLVVMLKALSPHFADNIGKKEVVFRNNAASQPLVATRAPAGANNPSFNSAMRDFLNSDISSTMHHKHRQDATNTRASMADTKRHTKRANVGTATTSLAPQRVLQPSQRWANLGLVVAASLELSKGAPATSSKKSPTKPKAPKSTNTNTRRIASGNSTASSTAPFLPKRHGSRPGSELPDFEESDTDPEEEAVEERKIKIADLPPEYWSIQKLLKYLSGGNQTATIISLCSLRDFDLTSEACQYAIREGGGLDLLINLLETEDDKCKVGALYVLRDVATGAAVKKAICEMDGIRPLVSILSDGATDQLKCLAAQTLANCAEYSANRRLVRYYGGIKKAVKLLEGSPNEQGENELARSGALALWSCSKSTKNKEAMLKVGIMPLLAKLVLHSENVPLLIPVVGILEEAASMEAFRQLMRELNIVPRLVSFLRHESRLLQQHAAGAIFHCAEDADTRVLVRNNNGLEPLIKLLTPLDNTDVLFAASGAIWKCALDEENRNIFTKLKAVELLVPCLTNQPERVISNAAGALSELGKNEESRKSIRSAGGLEPLIALLTSTNQGLLINVTRAVGVGALNPDAMALIDKLDGVRLLWSLLKSTNTHVQSSAAWAIVPCLEQAKNAAEIVRSFVGGLELIVGLLRSEDLDVLAAVSAAIATIAKDQENLAVITDHGVVPLLSALTSTTNDTLRRYLAEAIANCCDYGSNRQGFGRENAVAPLFKFLKSKNLLVHRTTACALNQLSKDPENCVTMHKAGVVQPLLDMVGSTDIVLQEAAAYCLANIRRLALANEMSRYA